jgi:hypothetical protein
MDIYSKNVPNFVYTPVSQFATIDNINQLKKEPDSFIDKYILKFKTAIYASIIFAVLSLPISYKILEMISKLFSNNIDIFDEEYNEPYPLGRFIMSIFVFIIIFVL